MYTIDENKRRFLRNKIIVGAKKYSNNLIGNVFLILCGDGTDYEVRFLAKDFIHLTGVMSNLSDTRFFDNSKNNLLGLGNILGTQKYNWDTLKGKAQRIEKIDRIVYGTNEDSLFMVNLHTHTVDFPTAIRNRSLNTCVGFKDTDYRARTLRKYSNSKNADEQKIIVAILKRKTEQKKYNDIVYINEKNLLRDIKFSLKALISEDIMILLFSKVKMKNVNPRNMHYYSVYKKRHIPICFKTNRYSENLKLIKLKNRF